MGINAPAAAFLARARQAGVTFSDTVTIGRMAMTVPEDAMTSIAENLGLDPATCRALASDRYADRFFRDILGAENLRSIDHSPYQDASILQDLNQPVPEALHGCCDVLYDGGVMEHVFDVKQLLTNYMSLVRKGGRIFINVPANNLFGHGFYQFSSEFFFRVFDASNGFAVRSMFVVETPYTSVEAGRAWRCYQTVDPAAVGTRVRLVSEKPLLLFVEAERVEVLVPFARSPMQSDYQVRWDRDETAREGAKQEADVALEEQLVEPFSYLTPWQGLKRRFKQYRKHSLRNRRFFKPMDPL